MAFKLLIKNNIKQKLEALHKHIINLIFILWCQGGYSTG